MVTFSYKKSYVEKQRVDFTPTPPPSEIRLSCVVSYDLHSGKAKWKKTSSPAAVVERKGNKFMARVAVDEIKCL